MNDTIHRPVVLVVEDDKRLHPAIARALAAYRTSIVSTGTDALSRIASTPPPDVVLLDLGLPDVDGVEVIRRANALRRALPVVVITVTTEPGRILDSLRAGARGYLFKEDLARRAADAIEEVLVGGVPLSREVARILLAQVQDEPDRPDERSAEPSILTVREREVLSLLTHSMTYEHVAADLGISLNTVRAHIKSIYEKLGVSTRTQAVIAAMERRLLETPRQSLRSSRSER